jgi:hypothetical protein
MKRKTYEYFQKTVLNIMQLHNGTLCDGNVTFRSLVGIVIHAEMYKRSIKNDNCTFCDILSCALHLTREGAIFKFFISSRPHSLYL